MTQPKSLFIPLKTLYYEQFAAGAKTIEYRKYGPRWNERVCKVGRPVTLSKGYGKRHRLNGVITAFCKSRGISTSMAWIDCYGPGECDVACITIRVLESRRLEPEGDK